MLAGVKAAQKKKKTPIETLEALLKGWGKDLAAVRKKTVQLRDHCEKHQLSKLTSFILMAMEEEISKTIAEFGVICDYFDLNVECLNYTPPLQEKVIAIV